ncbi:hypothetical protein A9Q84_16130 [Halobacteriovorax marinus]|uniref:Lipoprotein n=1 Tax=Halobacteriovorax marinus TaxID=97084 RepID=A0A1Y5F456_9BACT|nr:hypothetical protein A9Q84_16130 [Halobacteriovorax marinus]
MLIRVLLITILFASCSQIERRIASIDEVNSCSIRIRDFLRTSLDFNTRELELMSPLEKEFFSPVEVYLNKSKILYRSVYLNSENYEGAALEILPEKSGNKINKYIGSIYRRFGGTRVFIFPREKSSSLGFYTKTQNFVYLSQKTALSLNNRGFQTLSHEARHSMYSHLNILRMKHDYQGAIRVVEADFIPELEKSSYKKYVNFEESKNFNKDAQRLFLRMKNSLINGDEILLEETSTSFKKKIKSGARVSTGMRNILKRVNTDRLDMSKASRVGKYFNIEIVELQDKYFLRVDVYLNNVKDIVNEKKTKVELLLPYLDEEVVKKFQDSGFEDIQNVEYILLQAKDKITNTREAVLNDFRSQRAFSNFYSAFNEAKKMEDKIFLVNVYESAFNISINQKKRYTPVELDLVQFNDSVTIESEKFEMTNLSNISKLISSFFIDEMGSLRSLDGGQVYKITPEGKKLSLLFDRNGRYLGLESEISE